MAVRNVVLANGQLGTSAATLLSGAAAPSEGLVDVLLNNTGTTEETILLTLQVRGGTARRVARVVLNENQAAHIRRVPLGFEDTLLAVTTTASAVDYVVTVAGCSPSVDVLSGDGTNKATAVLRRMLFGMELAHGAHRRVLGRRHRPARIRAGVRPGLPQQPGDEPELTEFSAATRR